MEEITDHPSSHIAAVDLGSNSFHMIVAQPLGADVRILDRIREPIRLAAGLDGENALAEEARRRALACLARFGQRLRGLPPGSVRAVGTNTLRKARSTHSFLEEASEALGHPIEVIAGREEARLIYLGVSHSLPVLHEPRLVVDIGGGSTEIIIGRHFESMHMESLYMGCVSASQAHFPRGGITAAAMEQAIIAARLELQPVEHAFRRLGWAEAIGASGTIRAVGEVVRAMGWCSDGITLDSLHQLVAALIAAGRVERLALAGLKEERAPVFAGGVAVLLAVFEALGIERMHVSDWALREGLLFDLIGRIRHEDVRERTIAALCERYHVDREQAQRVEGTARRLLAKVAAGWALGEEEAENLLGWSARLHEIGLAIAHNQYHKHGAYLLENSDLPGFSRGEQKLLSILVRSHRRKFPTADFKELRREQMQRILRLAVVLRLAVLMHRSRSDAVIPTIGVVADGKSLSLRFPEGWLDAHPLTVADLEREAGFLKAGKLKLNFS